MTGDVADIDWISDTPLSLHYKNRSSSLFFPRTNRRVAVLISIPVCSFHRLRASSLPFQNLIFVPLFTVTTKLKTRIGHDHLIPSLSENQILT